MQKQRQADFAGSDNVCAAENAAYPLGGIFGRYPGMDRYLFTESELFGKLFECPSDRLPPNVNAEFFRFRSSCYGDNLFGMATGGTPEMPMGNLGLGGILVSFRQLTERDPPFPQPESAVVAPADMIALGDAFAEASNKIYRSLQQEFGSNFPAVGSIQGVDSQKWARTRHNSRANIAYCDGHLETVRFSQLFAKTDEAYQRWNVDHRPHRELRIWP